MDKVVRTICLFTNQPTEESLIKIKDVSTKLTDRGYLVQTNRICSPVSIKEIDKIISDGSVYCSVGVLRKNEAESQLEDFLNAKNVAFNIELGKENITKEHANILFRIIETKPGKTFNFTYVFNNSVSSPFFPSASYDRNGFSLGLQPTDLSEGCLSIDDWLNNLKKTWSEINELFKDDNEFLGIDSSIAPLFKGKSSFLNFIKRLGLDFSESVLTSTYLRITKFIKEENPNPVGLCGLMFPCLEDFELAEEYEKGNFTLERNVFLSLHSGLGIDTYPIGIDESVEKVVNVLSTVQGLSNKYQKPLSVRFVSDGKAKIGDKTDFQNQYLKDVIVKGL